MGEHYNHDTPLHNTEPIILKEKAEVNIVTTHAKSAEQEQLTLKLPDLQIRVWDIFKTLDKHQLITNAEKVLDMLDPAKMRELQNQDQSTINLQKFQKAKCNSRQRQHTQDEGRSQRRHTGGYFTTQTPQTIDHHIHT